MKTDSDEFGCLVWVAFFFGLVFVPLIPPLGIGLLVAAGFMFAKTLEKKPPNNPP